MPDLEFSNGGPPVNETGLNTVEARMGVALPSTLRRFYLRQNGGRPKPHIYVDAHGDDYEVHSFKAVGATGPAGPSLEETFENIVRVKGLLPDDMIPFAIDSGGNFYCMDVSGSVFFAAMDVGSARPIKIAASIDDFLDGLKTEADAYG